MSSIAVYKNVTISFGGNDVTAPAVIANVCSKKNLIAKEYVACRSVLAIVLSVSVFNVLAD
jgi:hypothetical protein